MGATTVSQVLACLRMELFRTLLMERIEFFDRHAAAELAGLLSVELDAVRAFVFGNVSRDRGARAALEASGAVAVLFVLSWRLGPVLAAVIVVRPHACFQAPFQAPIQQVRTEENACCAGGRCSGGCDR